MTIANVPPGVTAALTAVRTPVCAYVYDRAVMLDQVARIREQLPAAAELYFAIKANSHPLLIEAIVPHVDGLEVASGGELDKAITADTPRVLFSGPAKTDVELTRALRHYAVSTPEPCRLLINAESLHELRRIDYLARQNGVIANVALRVNRRSCPLQATLRMTGCASAFGIDESELAAVVAVGRRLRSVRLLGFHLHAFSNNLDAKAHAAFVREAVTWSTATARALRLPLKVVDVGGGIGIDYSGDSNFDLGDFGAGLPFVSGGLRVIFELGRYLVADAGWYAAEVIDLKRNHGQTFALIRGGMHHFRLPVAWGYSHPFAVLSVERWQYKFPRPTVTDTDVNIAGELCTSRDVLCRNQRVDRLRVGDVVVFSRTGAYGWEISHHEFLAHDKPEFIVL